MDLLSCVQHSPCCLHDDTAESLIPEPPAKWLTVGPAARLVYGSNALRDLHSKNVHRLTARSDRPELSR
jgi:hypothetical protein